MNGRQQVEFMAKLCNPDQRAPAESAWQADQVGGIRIGDAVRLPNIECVFEVVGIADPMLTLRAPSGREVKAGWRSVQRVGAKR